jgi:hypothetical protein
MALPIGCWLLGRRVAMIVIAVGISAPPVKPWPTRPTIIIVSVGRYPAQYREGREQSGGEQQDTVRRPSTRTSQPDSGMMTISATR